MAGSGAMTSVKFNRAQLKKREPLNRKDYIGKGKTVLNYKKSTPEMRKQIQQKKEAYQQMVKRNKIIALVTFIALAAADFILVSFF